MKTREATLAPVNSGALDDLIAQGAVLATLFLPLAAQEIRVEGFETEKIGLLTICAALIAGYLLIQVIKAPGQIGQRAWRFVQAPVNAAALLVLIAAAISTAFSLSPSRSLFGAPHRWQGALTLGMYLLVFWQAQRLTARARAMIFPALFVTAIPICLWAVTAQNSNLFARPSSTIGQPNFLAEWLVIVLLYCVPQMMARIAEWTRPLNRWRLVTLAIWGAWLLLIVLVIYFTGSRSGELGLLVGGLFLIAAYAVLSRRRRLLYGLGVCVVIGIAALALLSALLEQQQWVLSGRSRLFVFVDPTRTDLWKAALPIVENQSAPLVDLAGNTDRWAGARPVVGYGPEVIDELQSRVGEVMGPFVFIDSFHNMILDAVASQGLVGLCAWLLLYQTALSCGLHWLGFSNSWQSWLATQVATSALGAGIVIIVFPDMPLAILGGAMGSVFGLFVWMSLHLSTRTRRIYHFTSQSILIMGILAIIIAEWVIQQFGFANAATQPLFWLMLGLLVQSTRQNQPDELIDSQGDWYLVALCAGAMSLHSLGVNIESQFVNQASAPTALPIFLLVVLIAATVMTIASRPSARWTIHLRWLAVILATWGILLFVKRAFSIGSASMLNTALGAFPARVDTASIASAVQFLSVNGILAVLMVIATLVCSEGLSRLTPAKRTIALALLLVCLCGGTLAYVRDYTGAVAESIGLGFTQINKPDAVAAATIMYSLAADYVQVNSRLRMEWLSAFQELLKQSPPAAVQQEIQSEMERQQKLIFQWEPYFVNTQSWKNFVSPPQAKQ